MHPYNQEEKLAVRHKKNNLSQNLDGLSRYGNISHSPQEASKQAYI
jgi:hypothetical protein